MRRAGSASWRFAEGIEQLPLVALFVRDTLGLAVPAGVGIPPRLDGELPDHSALPDSELRIAAGASWTGWWQAAVARDVRRQLRDPGPALAGRDATEWVRQMVAEDRRLNAGYPVVFDPPEFNGLADRPALREAPRPSKPPASTGSARARYAPALWSCPFKESGGTGSRPAPRCAR